MQKETNFPYKRTANNIYRYSLFQEVELNLILSQGWTCWNTFNEKWKLHIQWRHLTNKTLTKSSRLVSPVLSYVGNPWHSVMRQELQLCIMLPQNHSPSLLPRKTSNKALSQQLWAVFDDKKENHTQGKSNQVFYTMKIFYVLFGTGPWNYPTNLILKPWSWLSNECKVSA